jgi:glycerate 2-kinase
LKPENSLQDNDAHSFFSALGDSVITGPTLTNVNDFRAILVAAGGGGIGERKPLSGTL